MHILIAIILIAALASGWNTYGPKWVLKAIAWTAGGTAAFTALIVAIALAR